MNIIDVRNKMIEGISINDINLRVVYYARVSTDYESQNTSIENQVNFFKEYINSKKNWINVGGYVDEGISGTSIKNRINFMRMIRDSKKDMFDFVITKNVTRFARNTLDSILYTQELLKNNVGVLFLNDNINTLMPDSDLRLAIMSSIAQDEVRRLSENVRFGLKKSLDKGIILGGNNLYGYKKENNMLIPIESESRVINEIYNLFSTGKYNYSTLNKELKKRNIYNRNNKEFNQSTIKRILTNPKYIGCYCGNKTRKIDYKLNKRIINNKKEWIIYKDEKKIIPIIDDEKWNKVNNIINNKKNSYKIYKKIFTNKIMCYEHMEYFTRSSNCIWTCKLYKRGIKYCRSVLIKENELKNLIGKIFKINKNLCIKKYNMITKNNYTEEINKLFKKIDINEFKIENLIDKMIVRKNNKSYYIYLFSKYKKKIKVCYLQ